MSSAETRGLNGVLVVLVRLGVQRLDLRNEGFLAEDEKELYVVQVYRVLVHESRLTAL